MAESLAFTRTGSRTQIYLQIVPQIESLISVETDLIANLANIAAALKEAFDFFWVGFYLKKDDQLVLGPFQGPLACTRIDFGAGVCGTAFLRKETVIVPNVDEFAGHISCNSASRSEIVVPVFGPSNDVFAVLDVDSRQLDDFGDEDKAGLERIASLISQGL